MNRPLRLAAVVLGVVAVVLAAAVVPTVLGRDTPGPPLGAVLDGPDRGELGAEPVRRGTAPGAADERVDLTDPEAVARAYLVAARATTADDRGRTHLRAAAYAEPGSPPAAVGVVVLDPPAPGQARAAAVRELDLVAADRADRRRGYRATVATTTGSAVADVSTDYVVLARQPDGRWLVAADAPVPPDGDD